MTPDERWARWRSDITVAYADIVGLFHNRHMWKCFIEMLGSNSEIRHHTAVNDWLTRNYSTTQAVGIRRESYTTQGQVTLARVMADIEKFPTVATYDRFILGVDADLRDTVETVWHRWQPSGRAHISADVVAQDRELLREAAAPVRRYVSKRLAHRDRDERTDDQPLTFGDIDRALDQLGEMLKLYYGLITGMQLAYVTPITGAQWVEMFQVAWATSDYAPPPEHRFG